jgi:hypothetical protein
VLLLQPARPRVRAAMAAVISVIFFVFIGVPKLFVIRGGLRLTVQAVSSRVGCPPPCSLVSPAHRPEPAFRRA